MGIDVAITNEDQEVRQILHDSQMLIPSLVMNEWGHLKESKCLRFVDPYGDAIFNQEQIPILLSELEHSAASQSDPETKAHLEKVCRLVSAAMDETHTYVKFIGD